MGHIKNKFFIKGTGAYVAGVLRELAEYKMSHVIFHTEGKDDLETDILLAGVGSGRFSGGGFDGIPGALVNDGFLDFIMIEPISRSNFLRHVGAYHDGKHPQDPFLKDKMQSYQLKSIDIEPASGFVFTVDGEPHYTIKPLKISLAPEKAMFVIPDGVQKP
jgi:diacylglycerol kinase (ATP)